jgi:hypothetical protein
MINEYSHYLPIGAVGERYAGKTLFPDLLESITGYRVQRARFSAILESRLPKGVKPSRSVFTKMVDEMGVEEFEKEFYQMLTASQSGIVYIDGVRTLHSLQLFRQLPNNALLGIFASPQVRYSRRGEKEDEVDITLEDFISQDAQGYEKEIPEILDQVDYKIYNEETIEYYQQQVAKFWRWVQTRSIS